MELSTEPSLPFLTVIVPVYNNQKGLALCCQALADQTYSKHIHEVIVVDNGSTDDSISLQAQFKDFIFTHEARPGSYAARNKGIQMAKGSIIAFIDSDCIPSPDWLTNGVDFFLKHPNVHSFGGKIEFVFKNEHPNCCEIYDSTFRLNQKYTIENQGFAATANFFARATIFEKIGLFNAKLKSAGDQELCHRLLENGFAIDYAPNVSIRHPAQSCLAQIFKKEIRYCDGIIELGKLEKAKFSHSVKKISSLKRTINLIWFKSGVTNSTKCFLFLITTINKIILYIESVRLYLGGVARRN